jgi:hypothetical protein
VGGIGHSVLVGDADMARIHRIGSHSDKLIQNGLCLLAGASRFSFDIHSSNIVFVMKQHFVEITEMKTDKCFLDWRMTDNCLKCAHFVALVKSKDGKWKVLCETSELKYA